MPRFYIITPRYFLWWHFSYQIRCCKNVWLERSFSCKQFSILNRWTLIIPVFLQLFAYIFPQSFQSWITKPLIWFQLVHFHKCLVYIRSVMYFVPASFYFTSSPWSIVIVGFVYSCSRNIDILGCMSTLPVMFVTPPSSYILSYIFIFGNVLVIVV